MIVGFEFPEPMAHHLSDIDYGRTFLNDPAAYGLDRPPMQLPAIQQLLGHADIATTTIYYTGFC